MLTAVAFRLTIGTGILATLMAASVTWLLLTRPTTVAMALSDGDVSRLLDVIVRNLVGALRAIVEYL